MRIADAVAALATRPDVVVVGNDGATDLATRIADQLGLAVATGPTDGNAVVLVAVEQGDLAATIKVALERVGGLARDDRCLVLVDVAPDGLPVGVVTAIAAEHDLELTEVLELAHPTLPVALHLVAAERQDVAAARTGLVLERAVSHRARTAASATRRELERRGARIDALNAEVDELRERLSTVTTQCERDVAARDTQIARLEQEVEHLEGSISYRLGHGLVRLLKSPRLLLRIPARIKRWLQS